MIRKIAASAIVLSLSAAALADRPLLTNDPRTLDLDQWQVNTAFTLADAKHGYQVTNLPQVDVNYGLRDNIQLRGQIALADVDTAFDSNDLTLDNFIVGAKWRFLEETDSQPAVSFFPQLVVNHHYDEDSADFSTRSTVLVLPVQVGKKIQDWYVFGEAGIEARSKIDDGFFIAAGVEKPIDTRLTLMGDVQLDLKNGTMLTVEFGTRYAWDEALSFIGSIGTTVGDNDVDELDLLLYLGAQWKFD